MEDVKVISDMIFRWLHIFAGITWIGLLYFFNFINGHVAATFDADSKKKVVPELMPRTLFWFRWGAAWTWITGFLLLGIVFYGQKGAMLATGQWDVMAIVMVVAIFLVVFVYDAIFKAMGHTTASIAVGFVLITGMIGLMNYVGNFSYRGYAIHTGAMFGTIMAFNVWFRIWPAQQKIITAIKGGNAPDAADATLAGMRSKHNTYLSLPLIWAMIDVHTAGFFGPGGMIGLTKDTAWLSMVAFTALGWAIINYCYKKAATVKGF